MNDRVNKSIVFIHGLFMNPKSWERWVKYFQLKGFECHAPAYPNHKGEPAVLRNNIPDGLGTLTLEQTINKIGTFVDSIEAPPILIGHSMGGLIVQKLINMNKGSMGICIDSAPPKGIFSFKWSFLKSNFPHINPLKGDSVFLMSVNLFQYAFCNTMSLEQTGIEYDQYVVPESRNIPRTSTGKQGAVDFKKPHRPLLFIAGEKDHAIPQSLNYSNYKAYSDRNSKRDFKVFQDRTHFICGQDNWEEIAEFIFQWIETNKSS